MEVRMRSQYFLLINIHSAFRPLFFHFHLIKNTNCWNHVLGWVIAAKKLICRVLIIYSLTQIITSNSFLCFFNPLSSDFCQILQPVAQLCSECYWGLSLHNGPFKMTSPGGGGRRVRKIGDFWWQGGEGGTCMWWHQHKIFYNFLIFTWF